MEKNIKKNGNIYIHLQCKRLWFDSWSGRSAGKGIGYPLQYSWIPLWFSWQRICLQCERLGFDPWVGKIHWRKEQLPTPVFWPGEFHGVHGVTKSQTQLSGFCFTSIHMFNRVTVPYTETQHGKSTMCCTVLSCSVISDSLWPHGLYTSILKSSVQFLSHVQIFANSWTVARQAFLSIINFQSLPKLMPIELVMPSNHLVLWCPLLLLLYQHQGLFKWSALRIRWPKYWSFSFSIIYSNEHSGLNSFRMDWLDPLEVQGTLKSLLQHHSSKASILGCSAFFIVQFSHPYMTTGKTIAFTRQTFVGKVMSLLFNMLSRLVVTFLPRSKHLFISWLQSPSAVI